MVFEACSDKALVLQLARVVFVPGNGDDMAGVGTSRLFENDKVIVWELFVAPGDQHPRHTHELPYVLYVMQGSSVKAFDADGREVASADVPDGAFMRFQRKDGEFVMDDGSTVIRVPATHSLRNVGESDYKELLIEFK